MTDEEKATRFVDVWLAARARGLGGIGLLRDRLTTLLAEVRAEERERCAKVCEEHADEHRVGSARASAVTCAALIREGK